MPATIVGTDGADKGLQGTAGDDVIVGLAGDDEIDGLGGNDRICGEAGEDTLSGSDGDDLIDGAADFDVVAGGPGNDVLSGGDDLDVLTFRRAAQRVEASIRTGTASGEGTDTFNGFEAVFGSPFDDVLVGDDTTNFLVGLRGNDILRGDGGFDAVLFSTAVVADLSAGPGRGHGVANGDGSDTLESIEGLGGSSSDDTLVGDAADNLVLGFEGRDRIIGGSGSDRLFGNEGADRIDGGAGEDTLGGGPDNDVLIGGPGVEDTATYADALKPVRADLADERITGEGIDDLRGVEAVAGTAFADVLAGDARSNSLLGNAGADRLLGRANGDFLSGGSGRDSADGGSGHDFCVESERTKRCEPSRGLFARGVMGPTARSLAPGDLHRLQRAARGIDARMPAGFLRSLSPLATLRRLVTPHDAVQYTGATGARCVSRGGKNIITILPPEQVKALSPDDEDVIWKATLRRYDDRGRGRVVKTAPVAHGKVVRTLTQQAGWPQWQDATHPYEKIVAVVGPGHYSWTAQVTWDYSGTPLPARRVRPHWQTLRSTRRPGTSCTFPSR